MWWWFYSWWCLRFCLGQCEADGWKIPHQLFPVPEVVGCLCMLFYWFCSYDVICPDNYNYSRFKLKDKCRSEKWEVYLYGVMTIKVVFAQVQFFVSVTCPLLLRQGMGPYVQKTAEVFGVQLIVVTGRLFLGRVHRYTARGFPRIRAGKGWRGRRELAPRCSATRISCISGAWQDRLPRVLIICTTHTTRPLSPHTPHQNAPTQHNTHPHHTHHSPLTTQHTHTQHTTDNAPHSAPPHTPYWLQVFFTRTRTLCLIAASAACVVQHFHASESLSSLLVVTVVRPTGHGALNVGEEGVPFRVGRVGDWLPCMLAW